MFNYAKDQMIVVLKATKGFFFYHHLMQWVLFLLSWYPHL